MNFKLELLNKEDLPIFKKDMQEAFQIGFEENYGKTDGTILPEKDIDDRSDEKEFPFGFAPDTSFHETSLLSNLWTVRDKPDD